MLSISSPCLLQSTAFLWPRLLCQALITWCRCYCQGRLSLLILLGHQNYIPANFFSVNCVRFFVYTEPEFPKIYRRLPKIAEVFGRLAKSAEEFSTTSEDNRRFRKIFDDSKTGPTIFKGFPTNLEHCSEDVLYSLVSDRREKLAWMREITILDPQAWDSRINIMRESWQV